MKKGREKKETNHTEAENIFLTAFRGSFLSSQEQFKYTA
jgi:hypothetical protein